jgi:hypothetical protein
VRAITTKWTCKELDGKSICAQTNDWPGKKGEIRAKPYNLDKRLLQIDLVFNISDRRPQPTEKLFHLTQKQVKHLRKSKDGAECDFEYLGVLESDNSRPCSSS